MFNCPELGIAVQNIRLLIPPSSSRGTISTSETTSCESLVRVCIPTDISENVLILQFIPVPGASWIHLAEVTFYDSDSTCQQNTLPPSTFNSTTLSLPPNITNTTASSNLSTSTIIAVSATCTVLLLVCLFAVLSILVLWRSCYSSK